jgi:hypothetical protein
VHTQLMPRVATCHNSLSSTSAIDILNWFLSLAITDLTILRLSLSELLSGMWSLSLQIPVFIFVNRYDYLLIMGDIRNIQFNDVNGKQLGYSLRYYSL